MATSVNHLTDSPLLLPPCNSPYVLREVHILARDGCCSEMVLQWDEGFLAFRVDEDCDALIPDFQPGAFEPSADHRAVSSEKLSAGERGVLKELLKGAKTKQQLGARAKLLGAVSRPGFGNQGGGLQKRGLIEGAREGRNNHYALTEAGRNALLASQWEKLLGKECGWTWVAVNQQGYCDSVLLSFDGIAPTVLLQVIASSIELFSITRG